ncbi:MAG: hypothetical protein ABIL14_01370 [candidate division WOR-3 bacterium]
MTNDVSSKATNQESNFQRMDQKQIIQELKSLGMSEDEISQLILDAEKTRIAASEDPQSQAQESNSFLQNLAESIKAEFPRIAGSIAGGIAGFRVGAPLAGISPLIPVGTAILGAGAGGLVGEVSSKAYKGEPLTKEDVVRGAGVSMVEEATGRGLAFVGSKLIAPFKKSYERLPSELKEVAKHGEELGIAVTKGRLARRGPAAVFENIASAGATGSNIMQKIREGNITTLKQLYDNIIDSLAPTIRDMEPAERGRILQDTIRHGEKVFRDTGTDLYNNAVGLISERVKITNSMLDKTLDLAKTIPSIPGEGGIMSRFVMDISDELVKLEKAIRQTKPKFSLDKIENQIKATHPKWNNDMVTLETARRLIQAGHDIKVDFSAVQTIRSELFNSISRLKKSPGTNVAQASVQKLINELTDGLDTAAMQSSPEAKQAWDLANQFWRKGAKAFEAELYHRLIRENPSEMGEIIFNMPKEELQAFKNMLIKTGEVTQKDPTQTINFLKGGILKTFLDKSSPEFAEKGFNFDAALKKLESDVFKSKLAVFFNPKEIQEIKEIFKLASITQPERIGKAGGELLIQMFQGRAAMMLGASALYALSNPGRQILEPQVLTGTAVVFILPWAISHMLASPIGRQYLKQGFKMGAKTTMAVHLVPRIVSFVRELERQTGQRGLEIYEQPDIPGNKNVSPTGTKESNAP